MLLLFLLQALNLVFHFLNVKSLSGHPFVTFGNLWFELTLFFHYLLNIILRLLELLVQNLNVFPAQLQWIFLLTNLNVFCEVILIQIKVLRLQLFNLGLLNQYHLLGFNKLLPLFINHPLSPTGKVSQLPNLPLMLLLFLSQLIPGLIQFILHTGDLLMQCFKFILVLPKCICLQVLHFIIKLFLFFDEHFVFTRYLVPVLFYQCYLVVEFFFCVDKASNLFF